MNAEAPAIAQGPPPPIAARDAVAAADSWPHRRRPGTFVDPEITRAKLDREIALFRESEDRYRRDGVILVREAFPRLTFAFTAPHLRPRPVVFGVELDFDNYDAVAPSVQFVDPFTDEPLLGRDLPPRPFWGCQRVEGPPQGGQEVLIAQNSLFQGGADDPPFLCVPGTREYHQHPFHTGDSWFLYRGKGVGTLQYLLEQLIIHGTAPLRGYLPQFHVNRAGAALQIHLVDLQLGVAPNALPVQ